MRKRLTRAVATTAWVCVFAGHIPAASPCLPCHETQVLGYQKSAMAHSFAKSVQQPSGSFTHDESGSRFAVTAGDGAGRISLDRDGLTSTYPIAFMIGSGAHASGDIVRIGDYLFQAPITYLTSRSKWEMAPGYEDATQPDFTRPITGECLSCHAGRPRLIANTVNRFEKFRAEDEPITCERCHGDTSAHLAHPTAATIINPKRLPARARDSVCEQCHLMGEVRVLNPGKQFTDFRPGQNLEDVFSVYITAAPDSGSAKGTIKVISHAEQLRLSMCARRSEGNLWCGTCHDPHQKPADPVSYFRDRCLSCHGQALLATHSQPAENCVSCHMRTRPAKDGAHTVFTDHRISRYPQADSDKPATDDAVQKLIAWREPDASLVLRNLGLANIELGRRQQSDQLITGVRQLAEAAKSLPPDPVVFTQIGLVLLQMGKPEEARDPLALALRLEPDRAASHINLAGVYAATGETDQAISELKRAIELDPSQASAYRALNVIYTSRRDPEGVARTLRLYLNFMPRNMLARKALRDMESQSTGQHR